MAKKEHTEQIPNRYSDEDLKKIVDAIEVFEDEKVSVRAEAAGKCSQIAKRIANEKKVAKSLGIPQASLNALLKTRKLERQLKEVASDVPWEEAEVFEDMTGQFSFLPPETKGEAPGHVAARQHKAQSAAEHQAEQTEGAKVLEELVH